MDRDYLLVFLPITEKDWDVWVRFCGDDSLKARQALVYFIRAMLDAHGVKVQKEASSES